MSELLLLDEYRYDGSEEFELKNYPCSALVPDEELEAYEKALKKIKRKLRKKQEKLFAAGEEGIVFLLQAMDAAGKDSAVREILSGLDPSGITDFNFKTPTKEELSHDYLWRGHCHLGPRGDITVFNRSYYEDVLVVRVEGFWRGYKWPKRCYDMDEQEFFNMRFRQIRDYERYLNEAGYRLVKIFLNVSLEEQASRFIRRIDREDKNYKFSAGDLKNRLVWDKYMAAYEDMIAKTATPESPWYIIPADQKPVARYLAAVALNKTLKAAHPKFPLMGEEAKAEMALCRAQLEAGEI